MGHGPRRLSRGVVLLGVVAVCCAGEVTADSRLDQLRDQVHREVETERPTRSEDDRPDRDRLLDDLAVLVALAPFVLPPAALDDDMVRAGHFPRYPYAETRGALLIDRVEEEGRRFSVRAHGEYIFDDPDLHRIGGRMGVDTHRRIGVEASAHRWRESLDDGAKDRLWTGDVNALYRFAQSERVQFRAGLGANWLHDKGSTHGGVNVTYQVDVQPRRPWVVAGRVDAGTLRRADLFRARLTMGALLGPAEIFVGYDYFRARRFESHGPVGGVGIWF